MSAVLVTTKGQASERWGPAFPDGAVVTHLDDCGHIDVAQASSLWLDVSSMNGAMRAAMLRRATQLGPPVVTMVAVPDETDAIVALREGVQGYCHVKAAPEQLREIAVVVEHGGMWMPPEFMRRFLSVSARVLASAEVPRAQRAGMDQLTARERKVAEQVARGASNREIAASLGISERTVKSHLTAIFDKLGLRDRVQLALAMNNLPTRGVGE